MSKEIELLYHHGSLIGYIHGLMRNPWLYVGEPFQKGQQLSVEQAVEIHIQRVSDKDPHYATHIPENRAKLKAAIMEAVEETADKDSTIDYIPDRTFSGDLICRGCVQFTRAVPDPVVCPRKKNNL